jgi:hypothetical protein
MKGRKLAQLARSIHQQTWSPWQGETLNGLPLISLENPKRGEVNAAAIKTGQRYVAVRTRVPSGQFVSLVADGEVIARWRESNNGEAADRVADKLMDAVSDHGEAIS